MFCKRCNANLGDNPAKFCPVCGTPVEQAPASSGLAPARGFGKFTPSNAAQQQAPAPNPYSAPAANPNPYGAPAATPNPYGTPAAAPNPYGTPAANPNPYGTPAPAPNPYGTPAPAPNPYGAPAANPNPYGAPAGYAYGPSMGWFKYLINFALFFSAAMNIVYAILYFIGQMYPMYADAELFSLVGSENITEFIYDLFEGLQVWDMVYASTLIVSAGLAVATRFLLSSYKKLGPIMLYVLYGFTTAASLLYLIGVMITVQFTEDAMISLIAPTIVQAVASVVMIIVNIIYFNKRKHLFH